MSLYPYLFIPISIYTHISLYQYLFIPIYPFIFPKIPITYEKKLSKDPRFLSNQNEYYFFINMRISPLIDYQVVGVYEGQKKTSIIFFIKKFSKLKNYLYYIETINIKLSLFQLIKTSIQT